MRKKVYLFVFCILIGLLCFHIVNLNKVEINKVYSYDNDKYPHLDVFTQEQQESLSKMEEHNFLIRNAGNASGFYGVLEKNISTETDDATNCLDIDGNMYTILDMQYDDFEKDIFSFLTNECYDSLNGPLKFKEYNGYLLTIWGDSGWLYKKYNDDEIVFYEYSDEKIVFERKEEYYHLNDTEKNEPCYYITDVEIILNEGCWLVNKYNQYFE